MTQTIDSCVLNLERYLMMMNPRAAESDDTSSHNQTSINRLSISSPAELCQVLSDYYGAVHVVAPADENFRFHMNVSRTSEVVMGAVKSEGHTLSRPLDLVGHHDAEHINFNLILEGQGRLHQYGRKASISPGAMTIGVQDAPYQMNFEGPFRLLFFIFPRRMIGLSAANLRAVSTRPVYPNDPITSFMIPYLKQFEHHFGAVTLRTGKHLINSAVDLIDTLAQHILENDADERSLSVRRHTLLEQAKEYIEKNLADPDLTPTRIAAALFITPRHLHGVFQPEGITVATWIRERRLEKCLRDLAEPQQAHVPVSAIGARWGFVDPSHFSRLFKRTYNTTPLQYREDSGLQRL